MGYFRNTLQRPMQHRRGDPELASHRPDRQPLGSKVKGSTNIDDGGRPSAVLAGQSGTVNAGSGAAGDLTAFFLGHP
jgi:hypothetical protein